MDFQKNFLNQDDVWDGDLIVSRDTSKLYSIDLSKKGVFRVYTDYEKKVRYAKISKSDKNYFEIVAESRKGGVELEERQDMLFIKLNVVDNSYFSIEKIEREISETGGVLKDPFSIWINGREYFRCRFINESIKAISDKILEGVEVTSNFGENYWKIEYLGKHVSSSSYFQKYNYPSKIVRVEFMEVDSAKVEKVLPHYRFEHIFFFVLGENNESTERAIRFTTGLTDTKGVMKDNRLLRDSKIKIYEDTREVKQYSISRLSREPFFSFPLESYQLFDGKNAHLNWILDKDDLPLIIKRMKKFNEENEGNVKMILESVNVF